MSTIVTRSVKGSPLTWDEMDDNLLNLKYGSYTSVKDSAYGAVGNGTTDDTTAIQACINANPGKVIFFAPGVYKITSPLLITTDNTRLVGAGANCTYIQNATTDDDAIRFYCTSTATTTTFLNGVGLIGIYIYRNTAATTGASIRITQVNGGVFEDFISSNCPEGVAVFGGQFTRFNRFNLFASGTTFDLSAVTSSCLMSFKEAPIDGGLYQKMFTTTVSDFRCTSSKKTETIFYIASSDGLQFSNAYIASAKYSMVKIKGLRDGGKVAGLNFSNIYFDAVNGTTGTEYILDVQADGYSNFYVYDTTFTGCIFGNTKSGGIVVRKSIHKLLVTGCTFLNINTWPIDFEGETTTSNVNITGNQFNYIGVTATGTGATRIKDVVSLVYNGNIITNDLGAGATLNLTGTINVASVTGNTIKSNSADISFSGATFTTGLTLSGNISTNASGTNSWRGNKFVNISVPDTKTLDWYEESSFTPGITFGGAAVGVTYGSQIGRYTRIGERVFFNLSLTLTSKGSSTGVIAITGLPYTSNINNVSPCSIRLNAVTAGLANVMLYGLVGSSTSSVQLAKSDGATSLTVLTDADIAGTANIYISGHYEVA